MSDAPISAPSAAQPTSSPSISDSTSSVADGANEVADQVSPQDTKATPTPEEIKAAIKKWKLKSQGKEREISDESELVRLAQLGLGAHEKFEQAASTRKKAEAILEVLQKDPAKALASLGLDVRKLAEEYLVQEANKAMLSPEQRQKQEIQQEIDRLKAEKDQMVREQREERINKLQVKYESDIQDQIITAIDQYKLPKNPKTVARIAEYMANALENGYEASALDVATRVRQDLEEEHKSMFGHYDVEDLVKLLGEDRLKAIRQHELKKVKEKAPPTPTKVESVSTSRSEENEDRPKKKMSMTEFQAELDKLTR